MLWFKKQKYLTIGLSFFAVTFGAGNLLFPPVLGIQSGDCWWLSITGFILTDSVFALMAFILVSRHSSLIEFGAPLGKITMKIFTISILLIFTFFIGPRTASMAYELSIQPWVGVNFHAIYFYIFYFALAFILATRASQVVDRLGMYFAPVLAITILIIIIAGIFNIHSGGVLHTAATQSLSKAVSFGYQTGDMLGALFEASLISAVLTQRSTNQKEKEKIMIKGGILCIGLFMILYYGLGLLGSRISMMVHQDIRPIEALQFIAQSSLGSFGSVFLSLVVFVVCFTTGMGVLGMNAHFCSEHVSTRMPYWGWGVVYCIVGVIFSYQGVDTIIKLAAPVLQCTYPMMLTFVSLRMLNVENPWILKIPSFTALGLSILAVLVSFKLHWAVYIAQYFWMSASNFIWLLPTILVACLLIIGLWTYKGFRYAKN